MDPRLSDEFWKKWDDVGGLLDMGCHTTIKGMSAEVLPRYIPKIHDGVSRNGLLKNVPWVAIPLHQLFISKKGNFRGCNFKSRAELEDYFRISANTKIVLVGCDQDRHIENFWKNHLKYALPASLKLLNIDLVTCPNYSLFTDMTGFHVLRNIKRIILTAERFSNAGIPPVLHLNAFRDQHWDTWARFLMEHPEITIVAKEFQTGSNEKEIKSLADLQQILGKAIHPILIGAARFHNTAKALFPSFSIMDSKPFMAATHREALVYDNKGLLKWKKTLLLNGMSIEGILADNIKLYPQYMERIQKSSRPPKPPKIDRRIPDEQELSFA